MGGNEQMLADYTYEQLVAAINNAVPSWLMILFNITSILLFVIYIISWWKMFTKAGEEGWKVLVPIYGAYIEFKIVYGNGWKFLLCLVPIIRWFVPIMVAVRMAQAYGKSIGFGILNLFFPGICVLFLAFGNCDYEGPIESFL